MKQNCLLVGDEFTYQFWLFHLFDQGIIVGVKIWLVWPFNPLILSDLLKFVIIDSGISDWNSTFALPSILSLYAHLSPDVFDFFSFKVELEEITLKIDWNGSICLPPGEIFQQNIRDQIYPPAQRAVVVIEFLCWNRWIMKVVFF